MKNVVLSFFIFLVFASSVFAKTPPEVLTPYKAYMAALEAKDAEAARKHAYEAWQKAEELMGESSTTSSLAYNFAMLKDDGSKAHIKKREKAFTRAIELAQYSDNPGLVYMERNIDLMTFKQTQGENKTAYSISKKVSEYAEEHGLTNSTFYGEALTTQAGYYASKRRHKKAEAIADKALKAFDTRTDNFLTFQPLIANMYKGYGLEGQQKPVEAALSYQKVMEALDGVHPDEHPLAAQALGRWSQMRGVLHSEGKLDEAEAQGLCKCWPYDKPRNEAVKPIKRVPPIMPRNAYVSGFSIVEFDLDDAGKPTNENILVSWPEGVFEKSSLKALSKWEYTPRLEGQTDEDRQNIVTTISYRLTDGSGNLIY